MNVIAVVDERNGTLFNHRRQSRDRVLTECILQRCGGELFVTPYTAGLFAGTGARLTVADDPFAAAGKDDWCFVEDLPLAPVRKKMGRLVLYRWDRVYPADRTLDLDLASLRPVSTVEFAGYSHEKITEEIYVP